MAKKKNTQKNLDRLVMAQELLENKPLPDIDAPDLLSVIEQKNSRLRSDDIARGTMYGMPVEDIALVSRKSAATIKAAKGKYVQCPMKREIKTKKTRLM